MKVRWQVPKPMSINRILIILALVLILIILIFYQMAKAEVYRISYYCACKKCCGAKAQGITASGAPVKQGMCAVDTKIISLGSTVMIQGLGTFTAADTGSAIKHNRIDIYCKSHKTALQKGILYREVKILERGGRK